MIISVTGDVWCCEQDKANKRRDDLEDSLQAQQYFADANEADSWMREKEPIVGNTDCGKDEDSAEVCSFQHCYRQCGALSFSLLSCLGTGTGLLAWREPHPFI